MPNEPTFPQIPESGYLSDFVEGARVSHEQEFFGQFVRRPLDDRMHPQVEAEGSWLNNPRNPDNN